MSYSTEPALDAARHYDAMYDWQERAEKNERAWAADFYAHATTDDLARPADWMPSTSMYVKAGRRVYPTMAVELGEILAGDDSLQLRLLQMLCDAARAGEGPARTLLRDIAARWASFNAPDVED